MKLTNPKSIKDSYKILLNPHGSDETETAEKIKAGQSNLLNPHGSDETYYIYSRGEKSKSFLTHTVQMKPVQMKLLCISKKSFLTHTVQMKLEITTPNII